MKTDDYPRFHAEMMTMAKIYGREKVMDDAMFDVYWIALSAWTFEEFRAASRQIMTTHEFATMPPPAAFERLRQAQLPTSGDAWERVRKIASGTPWAQLGTATSGDPVIDAAVKEVGGYSAIASHSTEWLHLLKDRFDKAYLDSSSSHAIRQGMPTLAPPAHRLALAPPAGTTVHVPDEEPVPFAIAPTGPRPPPPSQERLQLSRDRLKAQEAQKAREAALPPSRGGMAYEESHLKGIALAIHKADPAATAADIVRMLSMYLLTVPQVTRWLEEAA